MMFGSGWVAAADRGTLMEVLRGPAEIATLDVPGLDAFGLITSAQSFVPSPEAEALVTEQRKLLVETYGAKGRQVLADAQAYLAGFYTRFGYEQTAPEYLEDGIPHVPMFRAAPQPAR